MDRLQTEPLTSLLAKIAANGPTAAEAKHRLAQLIYDELKDISHKMLWRTWLPGSLSTTVLAHEAWMRVVERPGANFENRRHLFGAFARAAYRIIVEHGRRKRLRTTRLDADCQAETGADPLAQFILKDTSDKMNAVLRDFEAAYAFEYEVWLLSAMLGFSHREIAEEVGAPVSTVRRALAFAKADLAVRMRRWRDH